MWLAKYASSILKKYVGCAMKAISWPGVPSPCFESLAKIIMWAIFWPEFCSHFESHSWRIGSQLLFCPKFWRHNCTGFQYQIFQQNNSPKPMLFINKRCVHLPIDGTFPHRWHICPKMAHLPINGTFAHKWAFAQKMQIATSKRFWLQLWYVQSRE